MNATHYDKLIFDLSSPGRRGTMLRKNRFDDAFSTLPAHLMRGEAPALPEADEPSGHAR